MTITNKIDLNYYKYAWSYYNFIFFLRFITKTKDWGIQIDQLTRESFASAAY